ncbi:hypothetical protein V5799_027613, partial [Amblyomma americanum]
AWKALVFMCHGYLEHCHVPNYDNLATVFVAEGCYVFTHDLGKDFIAKLNTIEVPMFVLVASDDRVCDVGAMKQFFDSVPSKHKKIKIYEGSYHQILAEPEGIKEQAFMDIAEWFKESLYRAKVQHSYSQSSWTSDPSCTSPSVLSN